MYTLLLKKEIEHLKKTQLDTPLSNVHLDKSCEPGEPMIGNHKVVHCKPKSMKNKIFHWAILILAASSTAHSAQFGGFFGLCTTGPPNRAKETFFWTWTLKI